MKHLEESLQITIVAALRILAPDLLFWHVPNGGKRNLREAARLKQMGVLSGVADLHFVLDGGRLACIELKAEKGSLTASQRAFRDVFIMNGGLWAEARSLAEVVSILERWGVIFKKLKKVEG